MENYIRKYPVAAAAIAAGIGALLYTALKRTGQDSAGNSARVRGAKPQVRSAAKSAQHASAARTTAVRNHDTGAMDMEFTTHHADGKDIVFRFAWKKRPVDMPDAGWPVDRMGFTATRPDGKHTTFRMTRKTRPIPPGYGDPSPGGIQPGLGEAVMEFVSTAPGRGDLRFGWKKVPHAAAAGNSSDPVPRKAAKTVPRKRSPR